MYVCMYVCMYVYVCMLYYVCMYSNLLNQETTMKELTQTLRKYQIDVGEVCLYVCMYDVCIYV